MPPRMPTEKLLISISNPALMCPSTRASNFLMTQPAKGPIIMAPKNIGTSVATTTPIVAMAAITPPREPPVSLPPV